MLKYLFYLSVFSLALGQLTKIGQLGGSNLYLFDLIVGAYSLYGVFYFLITKKFQWSRGQIFLFLFTFTALFSLIWNIYNLSNEEFLFSLAYFLRWTFYFLASVVTYNAFKEDIISQRQIIRAFIYSGLFISLAGFVQLAVLPDFTVLSPSLGWDPHKNRLASTFFDPNFAGSYLSLVLVLILIFKNRYWKISLVLVAMAIFLTYSRSTWGALVLIVTFFGWKKSKAFLGLALLIAFLTYFAVPRIQTRITGITDPSDSAHFRLISWKNTLEIAQDNYFLGVGFNSFKKAQIDYGFLSPDEQKEHSATGSDSSFLLIMATTGILGLVLFCLGYFYPLLNGNLLAFMIFIPLFFQAQFINAVFYPPILFLWLNAAFLNNENKVLV